MYYGQGYVGAASKRYAAVHAGSRIEGASPHGLVKILFDELAIAMAAAAEACRQGERFKMLEKNTRALSILHALESSLDFEQGGDVAVGLAQIYRETRRRLISVTHDGGIKDIETAQALIAEIAEAWNSIG